VTGLQFAASGASSVSFDAANQRVTISSTDTNTTYSAGFGLSLTGTQFTNTAPDQVVTLTGGGATSISGTYPNFTISSTDTNTTYSAGGGLSLVGTTFSHTDTSAQASVNNSGATVIQDVTLDTFGHVTALGSTTLTAVTVGAVPSSGGTFSGNVAVTGNLTVDTNTLVVDAANNRVGVNKATPGVTLDVGGDLAVNIAYAGTVDLGNWTITESAGVLYFATGGVNKMKIDASGNLTVTGNVTAYGSV